VKPAFTVEELINAVPEILEINKKIKVKQIFNKFSENLNPEDWIIIAENIYKEIKNGAKGIVILHGTDTMHYTSSACSFMLKNLKIPVVFTGAQRSSDRGSSDASINLINSVYFANFSLSGIYVLMHENIDDNYCAVFRGTKVRKMHTSRRDAFKGEIVARINFFERKFEKFINEEKGNGNKETELDTKICKNVFLLKYFPGLSNEIFEILSERYKGIIIEGTGLGHVNENLIPSIKKAIDKNVFIGMTS
ncbi:MAG: Glu-tRNA(Gln) amidotransferase subunit GatD, partial [Candidatus Altarchaeaceae archaeon]